MPPKKRSADEAGAMSTRSSAKSAKKDSKATPSKSKGKRGAKMNVGGDEFKARALPLHVNMTNTPPSIPDEETVPAAPADPGYIGSTTLVPTSFATGSYGWKGNKRVTLELPAKDGSGSGEKVQVMITINATVVGSKNAGGSSGVDKEADDEEHKAGDDDAKDGEVEEHLGKSDEVEAEAAEAAEAAEVVGET